MLKVTYHISIGSLNFRNATKLGVESVDVKRSLKELTAKATIKIPRTTGLQQESIESKFKVGDRVIIRCGYDYEHYTPFVGYISKISPQTPLVFECEDEMWLFKQKKISGNWNSISLKQLVELFWTGETVLDNIDLGKLRITETTVAKVLETLQADFGIRFFFRLNGETPVFVAFRLYDASVMTRYDFYKNIVANELNFSRAEDVKVSLKAINHLKNGKKEEVIVGTEGGEQRTRNYNNKPDFKKLAENELSQYTFNGYRGSFTALGFACPQPGHGVELFDNRYPERAGKYFVDGSELSMSSSGGLKVKVQLDKKIS